MMMKARVGPAPRGPVLRAGPPTACRPGLDNAGMNAPPPIPVQQARDAAGLDRCGLICGYHFVPGRSAAVLETAVEAEPLLGAPGPGFLWLHFNLGHAHALPWLHRHAPVSADFFDALADGSRSTRIERDGDALFAVVNDLTFDFSGDASELSTLWLHVSPSLVLSARRQPLRAVDRLRQAVRQGLVVDNSVALMDQLLRYQADELEAIVRRTTDRIDDIEDAVLAGRIRRHGTDLARLRRLLVRLQRMLSPEPAALARTLTQPPAWVTATALQQLHGTSEEFALVLRDVAALQDRTKLIQDEVANRTAEATGRSLFTLTMVTVMALPINLIAGLMGMNVGGVPLAGHGAGFWIMVGLIGLLTSMLGWWVVRRLGQDAD
jgi:zinc transporter